MRQPATEERILEIYWETVDALYEYASRRCGGNRDLAEDVFQETWLRAVNEWRRNGIPDAVLGWLTTVARNLIIDQLRRAQRMPIDALSAADVIAAVEENDVTDSEAIAAALTTAMQRLSREEARLLELFHFERHKVAQIATSYGTTERAIEGRLRRARERLRHELEITLKAAGGIA
jgi:RNA polymerase sigma-70 factor (ECF subfamily)